MPKGINLVLLDGNLAADPELRFTGSGTAVGTLRLATNTESRKKQDGTYEDLAQFHRVVVWGPRAEELGQAAQKGDRVRVDGMLTTRSWDDQSGQKRYITEVKAEQVKHWPKAGTSAGGQGRGQTGRGGGYTPPPFPDDDIPF